MDKIDVAALAGDEVGWTLLGTLFLRAWESRAEQPILGDRWAAEALERANGRRWVEAVPPLAAEQTEA